MFQEDEPLYACLACLSTRTAAAFRLERSWFYRCRECHTLFCEPTRTGGDLGDYHRPEASALYNGYYDGLRASQSAEILRGLRALVPPPASLLDVGCGNGLFVAQAAADGYASRGIDTSLPPRDMCHMPGQLSPCTADEEARQGATYDVVTVLNVLEHVPNPDAFLQVVARLLRPGGILVCSMPLSSGMIYTVCEWFYRITGGSAAVPLKTVLQWHMAAPHVFLPTVAGVRHIMRRNFGSLPEGMRWQRIVDVRNLSKRIALERKQRHVTAWENAVLYCGGHALGVLGQVAANCGKPDEVYFFVRQRNDG